MNITLEQALSLRAALNQEKSVFSHGRLMRRSNELRRRYDQGESVLSLSKRFDAPPVNTFRAILTGRGWSKNKIKESLKSPQSRLKQRDYEQFQLAEEADRVSSVTRAKPNPLPRSLRKYCVRTSPSSGCATESKATWRSNKRKAKGEL